MKISIELDKKQRSKELDAILGSIVDFKITPMKVCIGEVESLFVLDQYYSNYNGYVTAILTEVESKTVEQVKAENAVQKAKDALKAAEEALEAVKKV